MTIINKINLDKEIKSREHNVNFNILNDMKLEKLENKIKLRESNIDKEEENKYENVLHNMLKKQIEINKKNLQEDVLMKKNLQSEKDKFENEEIKELDIEKIKNNEIDKEDEIIKEDDEEEEEEGYEEDEEDEEEEEGDEEDDKKISEIKKNEDKDNKKNSENIKEHSEYESEDDFDDIETEFEEEFERKKEKEKKEDITKKWLDEEREKYIWELKRLKKYNPNIKIEFDEIITPTIELVKLQNNIKREMILDRNITWCKSLLIGFWSFIENIIGPYFGKNFEGFTQYQQEHMYMFEESLNEIYERNYLTWIDKIPPEMRIMLFTGVNLMLFQHPNLRTFQSLLINKK